MALPPPDETRALAERLSELRQGLEEVEARIRELSLPPGERALEVHKLVFESAAANRCSRVLQVAHKVDEDTKGKYFLFDVSLYRAVPKPDAKPTPAGLSITTAGEYQRAYRYPRTEESFRNFYTGDFAEKVLADLTASGALAPLR